jgi:Tfp pilus assembly protein PilF
MRNARTDAERFDAAMGLGLVHERSRDYDAAEAAYREALQHSPASQEPFLSLYQMHFLAGNLERSAGVLREWLARNPGDAKTKERLEALERQIRARSGDTVRLP